jgi:hypothetical protein
MAGIRRTEKAELANIEKRYGVRWDEIHSYKDYMAFPDIPKAMPASVLLDKDFSFCEGLFDQLDRCLEGGKRIETKSAPYSRMQTCKPHWMRFKRCVTHRDRNMQGEIMKWEDNFVGRLSSKGKEQYADQMDTRYAYVQYRHAREADEEKKSLFSRTLGFLRERRKALEKDRNFPPSPR